MSRFCLVIFLIISKWTLLSNGVCIAKWGIVTDFPLRRLAYCTWWYSYPAVKPPSIELSAVHAVRLSKICETLRLLHFALSCRLTQLHMHWSHGYFLCVICHLELKAPAAFIQYQSLQIHCLENLKSRFYVSLKLSRLSYANATRISS